MGIHDFYKPFIVKKYAIATNTNILKKLPVYGLYIDLNGLLHNCKFITYGGDGRDLDESTMDLFHENKIFIDRNSKQRALVVKNKSEKELLDTFEAVFSTLLLNIINAHNPTTELGMYVDGKVPVPKIQQQRRRREKAAMERSANLKYNPFDGNLISPSTPFMYWVDEMIKRWISRHIDHEFVPPRIIYSSHLTPGEGEHKIADHFRALYKGRQGALNHNYILIGLDSDLIILSLMQKLQGIILVRENSDDIIDIDILKDEIRKELGTEWAEIDFGVMMSLLGNDFLPERLGVSKVVDLEAFYNIYKTLVKADPLFSLTRRDPITINLPNMQLFMQQLEAYEKYIKYRQIAKVTNVDRALVRKALIKTVEGIGFSFDKYRELWYEHVFHYIGVDNNRQLTKYGFYGPYINMDELEPDIEDMSYEYIKGIEWVLAYYAYGHYGVAQDWFYPYHYPPLYTDMYKAIKDKTLAFDIKYDANKDKFTTLHQLLAIIPKSSIPIALPLQLHNVPNKIEYVDMFPSSVVTDDEGIFIDTKRGNLKSYQVVVLAPMVDPIRIEEVVEAYIKDFTYRELAIYCEESEKTYESAGRLMKVLKTKEEKRREYSDRVGKNKLRDNNLRDNNTRNKKKALIENVKIENRNNKSTTNNSFGRTRTEGTRTERTKTDISDNDQNEIVDEEKIEYRKNKPFSLKAFNFGNAKKITFTL